MGTEPRRTTRSRRSGAETRRRTRSAYPRSGPVSPTSHRVADGCGSVARASTSSRIPLDGDQFATQSTDTTRPRRRSSGGPAATGTSHPGGTKAIRSEATPIASRSSISPSPATMTPAADRYATPSSARWTDARARRWSRPPGGWWATATRGARTLRIQGATNAAAMLSSRIACDPSAAARSVHAAGRVGIGQGSGGTDPNLRSAPWSAAAAAIIRWYRYPPVLRRGSPSVTSASRSSATSTSDPRTDPSERVVRLPHAHRHHLGPVGAERLGQPVVDPRGEDLDRHDLGPADLGKVVVASVSGHLGERAREDVEVAHHASLVQPFPLGHDLDAVVVRVPLVLRRGSIGHRVERPEGRRGADLEHQYLRATCIMPSSSRSRAAYASAAPSNANSVVASSLSGSSVIRRPAARRRLGTSHRSACRDGIVETCVLRIRNRRRWKAPPSGSATSLFPYQLQTSASPSCARSSRASRRASG